MRKRQDTCFGKRYQFARNSGRDSLIRHHLPRPLRGVHSTGRQLCAINEIAEAVAKAARNFEGALAVRVEDKRQGPPKLHDLPSLQKLCGSRFGWPASKTLEVAQELYDGQGKKIITYPRAEVRYLPQSLIMDVPRIVAGLLVGQSFSANPGARAAGHPQGRERHFLRQGARGCEPSRRHSQRQHGRQSAGGLASPVVR